MHPAMWELFLIKTNGDNGRCLNVVQRAALNAALKYAEKIAPDAFPDQQAVDDFLSNIMETPTNDTNVIDKLTQHHFIRAITIMGMEIVSGNNCRIAAANKTKGC